MHQNFPTKFFQFLTGRQRCVGSGVMMERRLSYWLILVAFSRFLGVIFLVVDSRSRINRLTGRQQLIVNNSFPIPSHTHTHTHTHTQHHFCWRQSWLCHRLQSFTLLRPRSFSYIIVDPFFITRNEPFQKLFDFVPF